MRARRARLTVAGGGRMWASPQGLGSTWTWRGLFTSGQAQPPDGHICGGLLGPAPNPPTPPP